MNLIESMEKVSKFIFDTSKYPTFRLYNIRTDEGKIFKDTYRPKYQKGMKRYSYSTIKDEGLIPLLEKLDDLKKEYDRELRETIGEDQYKLFYKCLENWIDGRLIRNSTEIKGLKKDIQQYLLRTYSTLNESDIRCEEKVDNYESAGISIRTIRKIIRINRIFLNQRLDLITGNIIEEYPIDRSDLMLHRGLNINENISLVSNNYHEKEYLTSYSLSINVAEKFAITGFEKRVIISGGLDLFEDRILACSLLNRSLKKSQLEFLVIPHWVTLEMAIDSHYDTIEEYELDYPSGYSGIRNM